MRFDPPLASLYFEQGSKTQIRAFFYKGEVPEGPRHYVATLTVSGDIDDWPDQGGTIRVGQPIYLASRYPRLEDSASRSFIS